MSSMADHAPRWTREPFRSVIGAADLLTGTEQVVRRISILPLAPGARIFLLGTLRSSLAEERPHIAELRRSLMVAAQELKKLVGERSSIEAEVDAEVMVGEPRKELATCAALLHAELLVLPRRQQRPRHPLAVVSAVRFARHTNLPTLVVGAAPATPYERPLVAIDRERELGRLMDLVVRLCPDARRIAAFHAFRVPFEGFLTPIFSAREKSDYRRSLLDKARAELAAELESLDTREVRTTPIVGYGVPAVAILSAAAHHCADVLVVATRRTSGLSRALDASVSEWAARDAACDVLIAPDTRALTRKQRW